MCNWYRNDTKCNKLINVEYEGVVLHKNYDSLTIKLQKLHNKQQKDIRMTCTFN